MSRILILNGPNLNLLGVREPALYGGETLAQIEARCEEAATRLGLALTCRQSNHEGALVDWIHEAAEEGTRGLVLNAGAYTHTSIALRDAVLATRLPLIEVHLSNVYAREPFRHVSRLSDIALGVIAGLGGQGYVFALEALAGHLAEPH